MRTDIIRIYKTLHTWTGILAGLALFIAFYAGAVTMLKAPLTRWAAAPASSQAVALNTLPSLIDATLAAYPAARKQFTVHLRVTEDVPAPLTWQAPNQVQWAAGLAADGSLQTSSSRPSDVAQFIDVLHMTAGIPGSLTLSMGLMAAVGVLYGLALVSGLIVVLPTLVKDLLALRLGRNLKRMWLDAHNVAGIVSLPFHLVIAWSAVVLGFHDPIYAVQDKLVYNSQLASHMDAGNFFAARAPVGSAKLPLLSPAQLLRQIAQRAPGFETEALVYRERGEPGAVVIAQGSDPRYLAVGLGAVVLDPATGQFINTTYLPGHANPWEAFVNSLFALHFGSYGGEPIRWTYFFLGLAGAFLFYSGNLLWLESRRKAQRAAAQSVTQRRSAYLLAALTVGVCLGCVSGISATIVAAKWLHGHVSNLHDWHVAIYYSFFLGSVVWAFLRGAARASVVLLRVATLATAAIPLTSLIGWLAPASGWWVHGSGAALSIDGIAAFGALALAWLARSTVRRVIHGRGDSVWSQTRHGLAAQK